MIDHISIGVRDLARAKRFYDAALKPLGYACLSESEGGLGYGAAEPAFWLNLVERPVPPDEASGLHVCFAAPSAKPSTASTPRRLAPAGATTARPAFGPITAPATTPPSRSTPTATASRPIAAARAPDQNAAMAPILYYASGSPYAWRVWLALEHKGAAY